MEQTALIVIDMQKAYFRNDELEERRQQLIDNSNQLIACFEEAGLPVLNVTTEHKKDTSTWTLNMLDDEQGYLFAGDEETAVVSGLRMEGARHITKTRDSAFFGTDLAIQLRERAVHTIVLLGVSTHTCIFQTAADAYAYDFRVILANDCIATHDYAFHDHGLQLLQQEYRQSTMSNEQLIEAIEKK